MHYCSFVDRDMIMRFHWGSAAGHTYTHGSNTSDFNHTLPTPEAFEGFEPETGDSGVDIYIPEDAGDDDPELGFENREDDLGENEVLSEEEGSIEDDYEFLAMNDMYGPDDN
jgi:hypothetical protein